MKFRRVLPNLFAVLTAAVGAINLAAALRPGREPSELVVTVHLFVAPAGIALLVLATYLARRRQRALWLTVGVLGTISAIEFVHGREPMEALISWALLGLLVWGRKAFVVRHGSGSLGPAVARAIGAFAAAALAGALVPRGFAVAFAAAAVLAAWELFRPLRAHHEPAGSSARRLVQEHGSDTLSAFKLRQDVSTLWAGDRRAFVSYRIHSGVLLIAGDPVGPPDALPGLLEELRAFAAERGLRVGAVGASEGFTTVARAAGLRALYLGDEAIVDTTTFTLEGKPIKKVRQAVNRLVREGYTTELRGLGELSAQELSELETVSASWRDGSAEIGFAMAMDGLRGADTMLVLARDRERRVRGYLHLVPAYGVPVMSLSTMRRERDTPNGLTDFLIVRAIEGLRERGIEELSLNFALFASWMHSPDNPLERLLGRVVRSGNRFFQTESLYLFNAKFFPRWAPRYLLHEGPVAFTRTSLAALWVEGQIPEPPLMRVQADRGA